MKAKQPLVKQIDQQGIGSLETGIRVFLEIHRLGGPTTLGELATMTALQPSKLHRYCVSLIRAGLLQLDGRGRYALGPVGFQLSQSRSGDDHASRIAFDSLPGLVRRVGETAFVARWGRRGPTVIRVEEATKPISVRPGLTADLPLLTTATGRVFAAYMDAERLEALIVEEMQELKIKLDLSEKELQQRHRAFARAMKDVRDRGLARTTGERYPGIGSFSAPIFDRNARVILAVTLFGLSTTLPSQWDSEPATVLKSVAESITRHIGGTRPAA